MALALEDVLLRRTHLGRTSRDCGLSMAGKVATRLAAHLDRDAEWEASQVSHYASLVARAMAWRDS
jgi:glycerol-3-phosphate dehydrogenase